MVAELLLVVAIIGVLVAISIPIFTNQLKKARLATNQANARSGYAVAMGTEFDKNAPTTGFSYIYYVRDGLNPNRLNPGTGIGPGKIEDWKVNTVIGSNGFKAGDKIATTFVLYFDKDGKLTSVTAQ